MNVMNSTSQVASFPVRRSRSGALPGRQRGVSLLIALIALVLMTIAGFSLMRSVDTGNVIAGNMAFREVTVHASDLGIEAAATYLNATIAPSPDADLPSGCAVAAAATASDDAVPGTCRYAARTLPEDDDGIPLVNWSSTANIPETTTNGVTYQFVVERLCNPDTSVSVEVGQAAKYIDAKNICTSSVLDEGKSASGGSAYGGGSVSRITPIHYRVTVRTRGPRNTVSFVQTLMLR